MRKVPFITADAEKPTQTHRVDLSARLKLSTEVPGNEPEPVKPAEQQQADATEQPKAATEPKQEGATTEPGAEQSPPPTAEFGDDFDKFKDNAGKKLEQFVENPEEFATMLIRFGNIGRMFFLPGIYEGIMFPKEERDDVRAMLEKRKEAEKQNLEPEFNKYELRLLDKWNKLEDAKLQLSYTEDEIKWLGKIIAKRIKDVTIAVWLEKYDWLIALAYLEFKHGQMIVQARAGDYISKKFGVG
jgi:hypothetical protein